jgi:hypothetical protein
MKLGGYRSDGTLRVLIPGGMTVLLLGTNASPPIDDKDADAYGPWLEPPTTLSWQERQNLGKQLDRARTVPLQTFTLKFPFQKKEAVAEEAPADTAVAAAPAEAAPVVEKALTKGDLLAQITEIAEAKKKADDEKAAAPKAGPKSVLKRLKLEYESEDREGDEEKKEDKKSEVAAVPVAAVPGAAVPAMNFGGAGSGNFGHSGRPGEIGGSGGDGGERNPASGNFAGSKAESDTMGFPPLDEPAPADLEAKVAANKEAMAGYRTYVDSPKGKAADAALQKRVADQMTAAGSKYWSKMPDAHQNAFADRVLAVTKDSNISAVTSATPTTTGVRFKTLDGHAANAINRIADRAGHRNTQRYDNKTGHYIVHVSTATKK